MQINTTAFLIEISQSIKFGALTEDLMEEDERPQARLANGTGVTIEGLPLLAFDELPHGVEPDEVPRLTKAEEDVLLRASTAEFPDWVASFIRRVILLFENLPEDTGGEVRSGTERDRRLN